MSLLQNKWLFAFRFAFQNIIHNKIKSLLLTLSMTIMSIVIVLGFSSTTFIRTYYYENLVKKYRDIDLVMNVSEASDTRYFSIRHLNEDQFKDQYIADAIPFFQIDTLIGFSNNHKQYVKVLASSVEHLKKVAGEVSYPSNTLGWDEVIVTRSLATSNNLTINDPLLLYVGESAKVYTIVDIIEDDGLFQKDSIFINKEGSLTFFLNALNPDFVIPNPQFITNLYNIVYFEVVDNVNAIEAMNYIKSIAQYENLEVSQTVEQDLINQYVQRSLSIYYVIIVFVLVSVMIVTHSTFLLYFSSRKQSHAITAMLGGSWKYSYFVTLIEMSFIYIVSLLSSFFGGRAILSFGLNFIGVQTSFELETSHIIYSIVGIGIIFFITSLYYFNRNRKQSSIQKSVETTSKSIFHPLKTIVLLLGISAVYLALMVFEQFNVIIRWIPIIKSGIGITLLFLMPTVFFYLINTLLLTIKKGTFIQLNIKMLLSKQSFFQYLTIILVSFLSIFLLSLSQNHMQERLSNIKDEYQVDYALTNLVSSVDSTLVEVRDLDAVLDADLAIQLRNIKILEIDQVIPNVISIDAFKINSYFSFEIGDEAKSLLQSDTLSIVLPMRYQTLYFIQQDDFITLYIDAKHDQVLVKVVGFYEKEFGNLAITNIHQITEFSDIHFNTILIREKDYYFGLKELLIEQYSKNLVYVVDYDSMIINITDEIQTNTDYMVYTISIMIICFVFSILNHNMLLFEDLKQSYAKVTILGASKGKLLYYMIIETFIIWSGIVISSILAFVVIARELSSIILLFGEYELVTNSFSVILTGVLIGSSIYLFSRILYVVKLCSLEIGDTIRKQATQI